MNDDVESNGFDPDETQEIPAGSSAASKQIGPYKLLRPLGEGGMGTVWLAEQEQPVRRQVALKLIKSDRTDKQTLARFDSERQALAMMEHPNIAKILDIGAAADGSPYFVMELVHGDAIVEYCRKKQLSTRQKLELMIPVCEAVQHAHQKGLIHRDLKPSNILVDDKDGRATPKVIDFGLAKALQPQLRLTEKTLITEIHQVVGTLKYMSPEQAEPGSLDVDTRTDVYSLGVLLYEVLTGLTPLDDDSFRKQAFLEVLRMIREVEPVRPSQRLSSSSHAGGDQPQTAAELRLVKQLKGDLDWIVMKAIERDRNRRYTTVAALADDLGRFLSDEPVLARPPSTSYRISKFVTKHRGAVTAAGCIAATLIGSLIVISSLYTSAESARERAAGLAERNQVVVDGFVDAFGKANPYDESEEVTGNISAIDVLKLARKGITEDAEISDNPEAQAALLNAIGVSLFELGAVDDALESLKSSESIRRQTLGGSDPETLDSADWLGRALEQGGKLKQSKEVLERNLAARRKLLGESHPDTITSLNNLGRVCGGLGQTKEAIEYLASALKLSEENLTNNDWRTFYRMNDLAVAYQQAGNLDKALPLFEKALELQREHLPPDHPDTLISSSNLANFYRATGKFEPAEKLFGETLDGFQRKYGKSHRHTLGVRNNLAGVYYATGRLEVALAAYEALLKEKKEVLGSLDPSTLSTASNVGSVLQKLGRYEEAIPVHERAREAWAEITSEDIKPKLMQLNSLGSAYCQAGRVAEALPVLKKAVDGLTKDSEKDGYSTESLVAMTNLACAESVAERFADAETHFGKAFRELSSSGSYRPDFPYTQKSIEGKLQAMLRAEKFREVGEIEIESPSAVAALLVAESLLEQEKLGDALGRMEAIDEGALPDHMKVYFSHLKIIANGPGGDAVGKQLGDASQNLVDSLATIPIQDRWIVRRACERTKVYFEDSGDDSESAVWKAKLQAVTNQILDLRSK